MPVQEDIDWPGEELANEIMAADHYLLVDYGWAYCAHCEWFIVKSHTWDWAMPEINARFEEHVVWREYQQTEGSTDEMWDLWNAYDEFGMAEDIHAGDRNYNADPEFWPQFEHSSDWKSSSLVQVTGPKAIALERGVPCEHSDSPFIVWLDADRSALGVVWPVDEEDEREWSDRDPYTYGVPER